MIGVIASLGSVHITHLVSSQLTSFHLNSAEVSAL